MKWWWVEQHIRTCVSRNFRVSLYHPRSPVLNHSLEGEAKSTQTFYTLALNRSRKVHTLTCKQKCDIFLCWQLWVLQTYRSLIQTLCTDLFIDDWPNHKPLREKNHASFYMVISPLSSSFTALSVWYGCVQIVPSSWTWWHSTPFGRKGMTFALLQAMFFTYGLFGRIVRTWSDGGVQPKLLLSFFPAQPFQDDSVSLQWLEINCKIRKFSLWQPLFLVLFVQCHRQGRKEKGNERTSHIVQLFI